LSAEVASVSMNKLSKPASNCRTLQTCVAAQVGQRFRDFASFAAAAFCSYTNDVARTAKTCQAPFEAKTGFAE
jgi:hypothetical protein